HANAGVRGNVCVTLSPGRRRKLRSALGALGGAGCRAGAEAARLASRAKTRIARRAARIATHVGSGGGGAFPRTGDALEDSKRDVKSQAPRPLRGRASGISRDRNPRERIPILRIVSRARDRGPR